MAATNVSPDCYTHDALRNLVGSRCGREQQARYRAGWLRDSRPPVTRCLLATRRVELRALCDVYDQRRQTTRDALRLVEPPLEAVGIEEVLASPRIDAVVDRRAGHLHTTLAITALKAGKHVYLEKPAAHQLEEHVLLRDAAERSDRVIQTGTQQRSGLHYRQAKEQYVDSGALETLCWCEASGTNFPNQRRPLDAQTSTSRTRLAAISRSRSATTLRVATLRLVAIISRLRWGTTLGYPHSLGRRSTMVHGGSSSTRCRRNRRNLPAR